jgi:hypothetical protein
LDYINILIFTYLKNYFLINIFYYCLDRIIFSRFYFIIIYYSYYFIKYNFFFNKKTQQKSFFFQQKSFFFTKKKFVKKKLFWRKKNLVKKKLFFKYLIFNFECNLYNLIKLYDHFNFAFSPSSLALFILIPLFFLFAHSCLKVL